MELGTLIGDVVGSRDGHIPRADLHARLSDGLAAVNDELTPTVPLRITVGDEYQGCFATVGAACRASLRLRLALLPDHDVRHGIGWGPVTVLSENPRVEDGPGWWAAREAIERAARDAGKAATRAVRTRFVRAEEASGSGPDPRPIEAALLLRDEVVGRLSARSVMLLGGLLDGRTQTDLAEELQVSVSALSQRVRRDGIGVLLRSDELLGEV